MDDTMHVQYCQDGYDITSSHEAKLDADEARIWTKDGILIVSCEPVESEYSDRRQWKIITSDLRSRAECEDQTFDTPEEAANALLAE